MSLKILFGKKLKYLREQRGLTQQELADLLGMQLNSIGQIEIGYRAVSFSTIEKIREVLDIPYCQLFDLEENVDNQDVVITEITNDLKKFDKTSLEMARDLIKTAIKSVKKP